MSDEINQWEYRVQTIGSLFGTKDEHIQETLNEWGGRLGSNQCIHAGRKRQDHYRCQTTINGTCPRLVMRREPMPQMIMNTARYEP